MKLSSRVVRWFVVNLLLLLSLLPGLLPCAQAAGTTFSGALDLGSKGEYPRLVDLDSDGDLDVVALKNVAVMGDTHYIPIWLENKNTAFTEHFIADWDVAGMEFDIADLDGDGDLDMLASSGGIFKYTPGIGLDAWLENDGAKPPHFIPHTLFQSPTNYGVSGVKAADMDNDGDLDVVVSMPSTLYEDKGQVLWYENDGRQPPYLTSHMIADLDTEPMSRELDTADVNGDGWLDVLIGTNGLGTLLLQNPRCKTKTFQQLTVASNLIGQIRTADFNGDGRLDVLIGYTWAENGGGTPTSFAIHQFASGFIPIYYNNGEGAVGDLDRDGHMDVVSYEPVATYQYVNTLYWFQNDGKAMPGFIKNPLSSINTILYSFHSQAQRPIRPHMPRPYRYPSTSPVIGDLNGDGNPDIACVNNVSEMVWFCNQAPLRPVTVLSPTEAGRSYTCGNKMDIFWRTDTKKAGTAVTLELWQGNKKVAGLGSSSSATGQGHAQVTLPLVFSGGGYRIKAVSTSAPTLYTDFSDEPFVIKGKSNGVARSNWVSYD